MKLERLHETLPITATLIGALGLTILAGQFAGSGRVGLVGVIIGGLLAVAVFFILRQRVWMLIPTTWMLGSQITVLPLPFSVSHLAILFALATFLLLKAFKIVRLKPKFGIVELAMLVVLVYLASVFVRNPVGVEALGSDRVGGRPYFNVAVACMACWVLSRSIATVKDSLILPWLVVGGNAFHMGLNLIADLIPSTVGTLSKFYSGITAAEKLSDLPSYAGEGNTRLAYLPGFGSALFSAACSFYRPFTLINPLYLRRFLLLFISVVTVLLSGFRSALIGMALTFFAATFLRRGAFELVKGLALGAVALLFLIGLQSTVINLPFAVQRTLSFLPGKWEYAAKSDAAGSTQWRVEMWKTVLSSNKYIENKWLGDGFGFTRRQYNIMLANSRTGTMADIQENFMISGGVHSGPVNTIRHIGYLGLTLFLIMLGTISFKAWRLVSRAKETPFFILALFVGIGSILHPFIFVLIFGSLENDLPGAILNVGMLKMLENSLDAHAQKVQEPPLAIQPSRTVRRLSRLAHAGAVR